MGGFQNEDASVRILCAPRHPYRHKKISKSEDQKINKDEDDPKAIMIGIDSVAFKLGTQPVLLV